MPKKDMKEKTTENGCRTVVIVFLKIFEADFIGFTLCCSPNSLAKVSYAR
jgi:hypothetical protein